MKKRKFADSTYERSFFKGVCWEFISFSITTMAVYIIYGNLIFSMEFSLILSIIKIFIFFVHERFWKTIRWGKIKRIS